MSVQVAYGIVIVSAGQKDFEKEEEELRNQLAAAKTLGIELLLIAINKIDSMVPSYSEVNFLYVRFLIYTVARLIFILLVL